MLVKDMAQLEELDGNATVVPAFKTLTNNGFHKSPPYRHLSVTGQTIVTTLYLIGIIGNVAAFYILNKEKKMKHKNKKHSLMLK